MRADCDDVPTSSRLRHGTFTFESTIGAMVHGLAGFFEAWLFEDITISTA